ncbi:MAG: hypothetical protein JNM68_02285 [Dinghuibacter sp.]|nr:hypothetical protein [Dinghuibacter sp.]
MNETLHDKYKDAALVLARKICSDAIWHNDACNWLGASNEQVMNMPKDYSRALGTAFYDGTAGVAYFLVAAAQAGNDPLIKRTAAGAVRQLVANTLNKQPAANTEMVGKMGFHTGYPGIALSLFYAAEVLNEPTFTSAGQQVVNRLLELPREFWGTDVIDGAAGAIPVILKLYKTSGDNRLRQLAINLGSYLADKADKQPIGWSWNTMPDIQHNLTGYGHGAAGMAHAFAELFGLTGDTGYRDIVLSIMAYENHFFQPQELNWPDFRNFSQPGAAAAPTVSCSCAWCHGAPGIGLSRLRCYTLIQHPQLLNDAQAAIQTTRNSNKLSLQGNYSLCHGLFGNAELLLYGAEVLQQPAWRKESEQLADDCINKYIATGIPIPNGLHSAAETPDFMLGTSGIGYFFLRLYNNRQFDNMLLVTP